MEFNIVKKSNKLVAYDLIDKKRSYGSISLLTGKFTGDTRCLVALNNAYDTHLKSLIQHEIRITGSGSIGEIVKELRGIVSYLETKKEEELNTTLEDKTICTQIWNL